MESTTQRVGTEETGFAILVQDSSLSHVETDLGTVAAGWTLFVNTTHANLMHTPERVVVAMSRAGELVAGYLERDPDATDEGWLIADAHQSHAVAPDGLLGAVTVWELPRPTRSWRRRQPGVPADPAGHTFVADHRAAG